MSKYVFQKLEYRKMDTARGVNKVVEQLHRLLDNLKVAPKDRILMSDAFTGKAVLQFILKWSEDGNDYEARIQKVSEAQKNLANNLAAIHLWLSDRCLNIRRGVESPAEAFGAHLAGSKHRLPASWADHVLTSKLTMLTEDAGK